MHEFNSYEEQDLDVDPVIFLQCGHFYARSTLDGVMEISEFSWKIVEILQFAAMLQRSNSKRFLPRTVID